MTDGATEIPRLPPELPDVALTRQVASLALAASARVLRPRPVKYVLFAQGRTGSTLFGSLLDSHPDVVFGNEVLRPHVRFPMAYVEGLRARPRHRSKVWGFHVKIYQLTDFQGVDDPGAWLRRCVDRGWVLLHLRRENLIRHSLSNFSRNQLKTSHFREGDGQERPKLHIDPAELLEAVRLRALVGEREKAALGDLPRIEASYERDLCALDRRQELADRIFDRFGVAPHPVTTNLRPINDAPLADIVENFTEVSRALTASPYAHMLT